MSMSAYARPMLDELDRVSGGGLCLSLWWRDDDATRHTPALDHLLSLSRELDWPVALAVIPGRAEPSLGERLSSCPTTVVLPHGLHHANHAPAGEKRAEFGAHRPWATLVSDARAARASLRDRFGPQALDIFVPPWNRIAPDLAATLPQAGYIGLSAFGSTAASARGWARLDTHLDPVDWRGMRSVVEPAAMAAALRRAVRAGATTIGLLTHHLMFDRDLWRVLAELLASLAEHPAIRKGELRALADDMLSGNKGPRRASSKTRDLDLCR